MIINIILETLLWNFSFILRVKIVVQKYNNIYEFGFTIDDLPTRCKGIFDCLFLQFILTMDNGQKTIHPRCHAELVSASVKIDNGQILKLMI